MGWRRATWRSNRSVPDDRASASAPVIRRPPAGCTSIELEQPVGAASATRSPADLSSVPARRVGAAAQRPRSPDDEPAGICLEEGARPRLVGADLALQLSAMPRSGPGGHPRAAADGSASRRRPAAAVARSQPSSHGSRVAAAVAGHAGQTSLQLGRGLRAVESAARLGNHRAGVQAGVHPHHGHARLLVARQDRGRDGRRPAMARQQRRMQVERAVTWRSSSARGRSGRSPPAPAGRPVRSDRSTTLRCRAAGRPQHRQRDRTAHAATGGSRRPVRRAWPRGAVTTPTRLDARVPSEGRHDRHRRTRPLPRKTVRAGSVMPATPARLPPPPRQSCAIWRDRDQVIHGLEVVDVQLALEVVELVLHARATGARSRRT